MFCQTLMMQPRSCKLGSLVLLEDGLCPSQAPGRARTLGPERVLDSPLRPEPHLTVGPESRGFASMHGAVQWRPVGQRETSVAVPGTF